MFPAWPINNKMIQINTSSSHQMYLAAVEPSADLRPRALHDEPRSTLQEDTEELRIQVRDMSDKIHGLESSRDKLVSRLQYQTGSCFFIYSQFPILLHQLTIYFIELKIMATWKKLIWSCFDVLSRGRGPQLVWLITIKSQIVQCTKS